MDKYQTLCQVGVVIFTFLAALCGYGSYHFGELKNQKKINQDSITKKSAIHPDSILKGRKDIVKKVVKSPTIINANNALIVTNEQSGGTNIVNYNGGKFNPANTENRPLFDNSGNYGINILAKNIESLKKDTDYSFFAQIPVNQKLKVVLLKIDSDKSPLWGMSVGRIKNWVYTTYDNANGIQVYTLDEERGDLQIIFWKSGSAKVDIYYNEELISSKIISWQ